MAGWVDISLIVIASYVAVNFTMYLIQDVFFFHPEVLRKDFDFKYNSDFEEIQLKGIDDSIIDGLLFPAKNSKKIIFYFKGNTRSIKGWAKFSSDFTSKGFSFFIIDYPGFGKSTGKRDEPTIYQNTQIAYNWLLTQYAECDIIIYGRSLGAGFAGYIASRNSPAMLILDSPFYNFVRLANYYTRILALKWILKYKVPLNEYLKEANCPVYIIHGEKDVTIPVKQARQLVSIAPERIKLFTIKGGRHNNLPKQKEYHDILIRILSNTEYYNSKCQR